MKTLSKHFYMLRLSEMYSIWFFVFILLCWIVSILYKILVGCSKGKLDKDLPTISVASVERNLKNEFTLDDFWFNNFWILVSWRLLHLQRVTNSVSRKTVERHRVDGPTKLDQFSQMWLYSWVGKGTIDITPTSHWSWIWITPHLCFISLFFVFRHLVILRT